MKFVANCEEMYRELSLIQGIIEKRTTLEILTHFLMESKEGQLHLTATDLDLTYQSNIPIKMEEEGGCAVLAQKMYDIFRLLPSQNAQISLLPDQTLLVEGGHVSYQLKARPAMDYPQIPEVKDGMTFRFSHKVFRNALQRTLPTVAQDEFRYQYGSLFFHFEGEEVELVTTDGHRLSYVRFPVEDLHKEAIPDFLLNRKAAIEMMKIEEDVTVEAMVKHPYLSFTFPHRRLLARQGQGSLPSYREFLKPTGDRSCVFSKKMLLEAIRRVSVVSSSDFKGIRFEFEENKVVLDGSHPDYGVAREEISLEHDMVDYKISFNYQYLMDFLQSIDEEEVKVYFGEPKEKAFFVPQGEKNLNHVFIMMPMAL